MNFTEKWDRALESRDRDALSELLDDEFVFVRHQSGTEMSKEEMLNMWSSDGPQRVHNNYRVIYENEEIGVTHEFLSFQSGKEAVLCAWSIKNGKIIRIETGATPIFS